MGFYMFFLPLLYDCDSKKKPDGILKENWMVFGFPTNVNISQIGWQR